MSERGKDLGTPSCPTYPGNLAAVTPHATDTFQPSVVWTTDGGDLNVVLLDGTTLVVEGVPAGGEVKATVIGVRAASTTATKIYRSW